MPPRASLPTNTGEIVVPLMHRAKTKAEFQRAQALWLRVALNLSDREIATAGGLSLNTVRCLQSRFRHRGEVALRSLGRGGRRRQNLSPRQEEEVLQPFLQRAVSGGILESSPLKVAYEQAVGHAVPKSTIYRMLGRQGWRKLAPRPHHPKAQSDAQEQFKKNSPNSSLLK